MQESSEIIIMNISMSYNFGFLCTRIFLNLLEILIYLHFRSSGQKIRIHNQPSYSSIVRRSIFFDSKIMEYRIKGF